MTGARRASIAAVVAAVVMMAPARADPEPAVEPLPTREVAAGVYVYQAPYELASAANGGAIANVGFVVGGEAVAVIDTGNSLFAGERLLAAVRERTSLPVRYVINTHMHPDHVLGNAAFEGAAVVGHAKLARALAARAETYLEAGRRVIGEADFAGTRIVPPTMAVADTLTLDLGGRRLELTAEPTAHTDNDLIVLDTTTGTAFLGDLLFLGHVPTLDGSIRGWLSVMQRLSQTKVERVVPGHGPAVAAWPEALAPQRRYLERLIADVEAMLAQDVSMAEAAKRAGLSERDAWALFDEFNPRNAIATYHELEWE